MNQPQQQIKIDLYEQPTITCPQCGGELFMKLQQIKWISGIQVGLPRGQAALLDVLNCVKCGYRMGPEDMVMDVMDGASGEAS
jgi:ssDNA-binding Zn-finger/Zn-ribbon topoisomerase 1